MAISDNFSGLSKGAKVVVVILGLVIGGYALAILGLIVMGVLANVGLSGGVTIPTSTNTAISTQLTAFQSLVTTVLSPYTTIAAVVIIAVLIAIFFRGRLPGMNSGVN